MEIQRINNYLIFFPNKERNIKDALIEVYKKFENDFPGFTNWVFEKGQKNYDLLYSPIPGSFEEGMFLAEELGKIIKEPLYIAVLRENEYEYDINDGLDDITITGFENGQGIYAPKSDLQALGKLLGVNVADEPLVALIPMSGFCLMRNTDMKEYNVIKDHILELSPQAEARVAGKNILIYNPGGNLSIYGSKIARMLPQKELITVNYNKENGSYMFDYFDKGNIVGVYEYPFMESVHSTTLHDILGKTLPADIFRELEVPENILAVVG